MADTDGNAPSESIIENCHVTRARQTLPIDTAIANTQQLGTNLSEDADDNVPIIQTISPTSLHELSFRNETAQPPPYSPSTEEPPNYFEEFKKVEQLHAKAIRRFCLIVVSVDVVSTLLVLLTSAALILYSSVDAVFVLTLPALYFMTSCYGRAGVVEGEYRLIIIYMSFYLIRWSLDMVALLFPGSLFVLTTFEMSWPTFLLSSLVMGIRGIESIILPCPDLAPDGKGGMFCPDVATINSDPVNFQSVFIIIMFIQLVCGLVFVFAFITLKKIENNNRLEDERTMAEMDEPFTIYIDDQ